MMGEGHGGVALSSPQENRQQPKVECLFVRHCDTRNCNIDYYLADGTFLQYHTDIDQWIYYNDDNKDGVIVSSIMGFMTVIEVKKNI